MIEQQYPQRTRGYAAAHARLVRDFEKIVEYSESGFARVPWQMSSTLSRVRIGRAQLQSRATVAREMRQSTSAATSTAAPMWALSSESRCTSSLQMLPYRVNKYMFVHDCCAKLARGNWIAIGIHLLGHIGPCLVVVRCNQPNLALNPLYQCASFTENVTLSHSRAQHSSMRDQSIGHMNLCVYVSDADKRIWCINCSLYIPLESIYNKSISILDE